MTATGSAGSVDRRRSSQWSGFFTDIHTDLGYCRSEQQHFDELIVKLHKSRRWRRKHWADVFRWAEGAGKVVPLLKKVTMPLEYFPHAASYHDDIVNEFHKHRFAQLAHDEASPRKENSSIHVSEGPFAPQAHTRLLANIMRVPSGAAESATEQILERMYVCAASEQKPQAKRVSSDTNFLDSHPPLFVDRKTTLKDFEATLYGSEEGNGAPTGEAGRTNSPRIRFNNSSGMEESYKISATYKVTLPEKDNAGIPKEATHFVWVYSNDAEEMPKGFVYLKDAKPLAVNEVSATPKQHAMLFKKKIKLETEDCAEWFLRSSPVFMDCQRKAGATSYVFVGPGEKLLECGVRQPLVVGAYVYFFEGCPDNNCYFPIDRLAKLVLRAEVPKQIRTMTHEQVNEVAGAETGRHWCMEWACEMVGLVHIDVPVNFFRLKVPDALHPLVLRSLAETPRMEVRKTLAAQAIAKAIFEKMSFYLQCRASRKILRLLALFFIAWHVRRMERDDDFEHLDIPHYPIIFNGKRVPVCLIVLWFEAACQCFVNLLITRACFSLKICLYERAQAIILLLLDIFVIGVITFFWLGFRDAIQLPPRSREVWLRMCLASAAGKNWMDILFIASNFDFFSLGPRILPILQAMYKVKDFGLITTVFLFACTQTGYSLSSDDLWPIFQKTFNLAFLQDFEYNEKEPEVFLPVWDEDFPTWYFFSFVFFMASSLVLAVAGTNIFIGVMSNAFDFYSDRAEELFVQQRAREGLRYALYCQGWQQLRLPRCSKSEDRGEHLWFCCHTCMVNDGEEDGSYAEAHGMSLRKFLNTIKEDQKKIEKRFDSKFDGVRKDVKNLQKLIQDGFDKSPAQSQPAADAPSVPRLKKTSKKTQR